MSGPGTAPAEPATAVAIAATVAGSRMRRIAGLLGPILALLAEGAWISVPAGFLQATVHEPAWLGIAGYSALAAVGWFVARRSADASQGFAARATGLVAVGAIAGWLGSADVRMLVLGGDLGTAIIRHPAGWLGAVAILRGIAHARTGASEAALGRLVSVAVPGLAIPILIGGVLPEPGRQAFLDQATLAAVVFLVSATLGLAVTRMSALASRTGADWHRNRAWLLMLAALVGGVTLLALPSSAFVTTAVQVLVGVLILPALLLGTIASIPRVTRRTLLILGVLLAAAIVIVFLAPPGTIKPVSPDTPATSGVETVDNTGVYFALGAVILVAIAVVVFLLVRLWMREAVSGANDEVDEERVIDRGEPTTRAPFRLARPRFRAGPRPAPTSAAMAYVALVHDLDRVAGVRRGPSETPLEHAARLRAEGVGGVGLDLLAADYELERWGARALSSVEERRGIDRWRRLRGQIPRAWNQLEAARRAARDEAKRVADALAERRSPS